MVNLPADQRLFGNLQRALSELLPASWRWRLRRTRGRGTPDAQLDLIDPSGQSTRLLVELKTRIPPAEIVRQLPWYAEQGGWLLAAPQIGPRGRELLGTAGISWVELSTLDCRIAIGGLFIERTSRTQRRSGLVTRVGGFTTDALIIDRPRRYVRDLVSGKALRVVRWLLIDPEQAWTLGEMAAAAKASVPFVSRTFATLERDAYLERTRGASRVRDGDGLLEAWATASAPPEERLERVSLAATAQAILNRIRDTSSAPRYALTAEAAAEQIAPFARFVRAELYIDDPVPWDRLLDLTPVPRGGNIVLITPADDGVFDGLNQAQGLAIVSRPQLYVDLKRGGGAAREAAEFLREQGELWSR
jgi:hypothetical protein